MNASEEIELARQWLDAALAGDFTSAWTSSDQLRVARIDYSESERWCRPLWDGSPIDNRNVLIRCWRGLGDAIHFIRYAPLVRSRARSLLVEAPMALIPLFRNVQGIDGLVELDQAELEADDYVEMEITELPYVFRTTLETIPCRIPYLEIPGHPLQTEKSQLTVGLCWCGGSYDLRRAMHLSDLEPLSELSRTSFFQLQRGAALKEISKASFRFQNPIDCSMDLCSTAALIKSLDLIVSVDTMVAHLAGALGKKVYLLLQADSDWRWLRDREDSPWYPTMHLLRQSQGGDWSPVVANLVENLKKDCESWRMPAAAT
ncbi:MAG: ADP-heptose--LPS heptosyltransferase [Verrucomicrobia bacterium]|nr:ADP-heptose--LPS heptosyltransferase [Verrucomicrobiota bacterium]